MCCRVRNGTETEKEGAMAITGALKVAEAEKRGIQGEKFNAYDEEWVQTRSHEGLVVATGEHNFHDDSDFYAVVYVPEKDEFKEVEYATTRFWTYLNGAGVDADQLLLDRYSAELEYAAWKREVATVRIGRRARVVSGKGKGAEGQVFWLGAQKWGRTRYSPTQYRCGIRMLDGSVTWANVRDVAVVRA